jgi:glutathione peroxidase
MRNLFKRFWTSGRSGFFCVAMIFGGLMVGEGALMDARASEGFFSLSATAIDGKQKNLSDYAGRVVLVVNVASQCGYTPQYEALEKLYEKYKDQGLVVLGFPSNDFGAQEPGSNTEILKFCKLKYGVNFPLFAKSHVIGEQKNAVYKFLVDDDAGASHEEVGWNFEKFLIGRKGTLVSRFKSQVTPSDKNLLSAIENELALKK